MALLDALKRKKGFTDTEEALADYILAHTNNVFILHAGDARTPRRDHDDRKDAGATGTGKQLVVYVDESIVAAELNARRELVKLCKGYAEDARVSVRNARRDANSQFAKAEKASEITEDDLRRGENDVQKLTDSYIEKIDEAFKVKESEVMEI